MKGVRQKRAILKHSTPGKPRRNAANKDLIIVIPVHGGDVSKARIGAPFEPMDFRQLIAQAKQKSPSKADQAFEKLVEETTAKQLNELLSAMRIKRKDSAAFQKAFLTLATAFLGVGQVAWSPVGRQPHWTLDDYATLYSLIEGLKKWQGLSERAAIKKIASEPRASSWLPYRPQLRTRISPRSGRIEALWQAWMKAKRRKGEILAFLGSKKPFESMFGRLGRWEAKLVELDICRELKHQPAHREHAVNHSSVTIGVTFWWSRVRKAVAVSTQRRRFHRVGWPQ